MARVEAAHGNFRAKYEAEYGIGNGWIAEEEDSCTLYIDANSKARLGTRVYKYSALPPASSPAPALTELQARIIRGTARIRSGPGTEYAKVGRCGLGQPLTIWFPAVNNFVRASCHNQNGWVHESLVVWWHPG